MFRNSNGSTSKKHGVVRGAAGVMLSGLASSATTDTAARDPYMGVVNARACFTGILINSFRKGFKNCPTIRDS